MKKYLVVSLHDVHPASLEKIRAQRDLLGQIGVRQASLLVVPYYHRKERLEESPAALDFLDHCAAQGDELVLHGYFHACSDQWDRNFVWTHLYTANEAECLDISDGELGHRIAMGRKIWEERGWPLDGFIAPAWLLPQKHELLLKRLGFTYTCRLRNLTWLRIPKRQESQSLCYSTRAGWRRRLSTLWNPYLFNRLRRSTSPLIRLSLHPNDFDYPEIRQQIREVAELALELGYEPVSYSRYAAL
jgi:predicted deacetylase